MDDLRNDCKAAGARLLIYAAVPDERLLGQGFYAAEAAGLRSHPRVREVRLTNRLSVVARGEYDGLVSFFYSHSAVAASLARLRRRPAIATGGGEQLFPELAGSRWLYLARISAFRATALLASRILATSTSDLKRMRKTAWFGRSRLELSFHGASAADTVEVGRPLRDRPPASFVTICGLDTPLNVQRKGIPEALRLLAQVAQQCSSSRLTIIGRTTCRDMVEKHARELGVAERVSFAGYVDEQCKLELLRSHRYYVQLSIYEGFGIGALEALSQGCQVIHSGAGGLIDTISDFGVVLSREEIDGFSLDALPAYTGTSDQRLIRHLSVFRPMARGNAIIHALFGGASTVSADAATKLAEG